MSGARAQARMPWSTGCISKAWTIKAFLLAIVWVSVAEAGQFTIKTIAQDVPFPGSPNRITVTLRPDVSIGVDTAITISGLDRAIAAPLGAPVKDGRRLELGCNDKTFFADRGCLTGNASYAVWNSTKGTVVFFPTGTWNSNEVKVVCFKIQNPDLELGQEAPRLYIETGGAAVFAKTDMWVNTTIKRVITFPSRKCYPYNGDTAPTFTVTTALGDGDTAASGVLRCGTEIDSTTFSGCSETSKGAYNPSTPPTPVCDTPMPKRGRVSITALTTPGSPTATSVWTDGLRGCGEGRIKIASTGVKRVDLVEKFEGCGCTGDTTTTKGKLVAGGGSGDGKFLAEFQVKFYCDADAVLYDTMSACAQACLVSTYTTDDLSPTGKQQGDVNTCRGRISPDITIINPGWGYTSPPSITFAAGSEFECTGTWFNATLNQGTGFSAETDIVFKAPYCLATNRPFSTLKACQDACSVNGVVADCTGYLLDTVDPRGVVTYDGVLKTGLVIISEGLGYQVADLSTDDVLSVYFDDGLRGCKWGTNPLTASNAQLTSYVKFDSNSDWSHIGSITYITTPEVDDACFSPTNPLWQFYHAQVRLKVTYVNAALDDRQSECEIVSAVEMAPAPHLSIGFNTYKGWAKFGDSAPLKIYPKTFLVKRIRQSNSAPGQYNTLTVSLATSVPLLAGANITISGLKDAIIGVGSVRVFPQECCGTSPYLDYGFMGDPLINNAYLAPSNCFPFLVAFECASSVQGQMVLTVAAGQTTTAGRIYVFSFVVVNPTPDQDSNPPVISVNATLINATTTFLPTVSMDLGDQISDGVANDLTDPFRIEGKRILIKQIYQSYSYEYKRGDKTFVGFRPLADSEDVLAQNKLNVKLSFNVKLEKTTFIEISGLTGIDDVSQDMQLAGDTWSKNALSSEFCNLWASQNSCPESGVDYSSCASLYGVADFRASKQAKAKWTKDAVAGIYKLTVYLLEEIPARSYLNFSFAASTIRLDTSPDIMLRTSYIEKSLDDKQSTSKGTEFAPVKMDKGWPSPCGFANEYGTFNMILPDSIPFSVRTAKFLVKKIGQTVPYPCPWPASNYCDNGFVDQFGVKYGNGVTNRIMVTISTNVPLDSKTNIVIGPLTGAKPLPVSNSLTLDSSTTPDLYDESGTKAAGDARLFVPVWNDQAKTLTLTPKDLVGGRVFVTEPGRNYVLGFRTMNPSVAQEPPVVSISATQDTNAVRIDGVVMDQDATRSTSSDTDLAGTICTQAGDFRPMKILGRAFCVKKIGQSAPWPGQSNTIVVTFASTIPLNGTAGTKKILISGWPGATVMINPPVFATQNPAASFPTRTFNTQTRVFELVPNALTAPNTLYTVSFTVINWSPSGDVAPTPFTIQHDAIASGGVTMDMPDAPTTSGGCIDDLRPLRIYKKQICTKLMSQTTTYPGESNAITMTFRANFVVPASTLITFTGFDFGARTGQTVAVDREASLESYSNSVATLNPNTLVIRTDLLNDGANHFFRFTITNPIVARASPAISMTFTLASSVNSQAGAVPIPPDANLAFNEVVTKDDGRTATDYMSVLTDANPLKISAPRFLYGLVGQANSYPSANNKITVTLAVNWVPTEKWVLAISGFGLINNVKPFYGWSASQSITLTTGPVDGGGDCSASYIVPSPLTSTGDLLADTARVSPSLTTLFITINPGYARRKAFVVEFFVQNPAEPNDQPSALVMQGLKFGTEAQATPDKMFADSFTLATDLNTGCLKRVTSLADGATRGDPIYAPKQVDVVPMYVRQPQLFKSFAVQSSPYPLGLNVLTVALFINVDVLVANAATGAATQVTISGMTGVKLLTQFKTVKYPSDIKCLQDPTTPAYCAVNNIIIPTQATYEPSIVSSQGRVIVTLPRDPVIAGGVLKTASIDEGALVDFAITVQNPADPQEAAALTVAISGAFTIAPMIIPVMSTPYGSLKPTDFLRLNAINSLNSIYTTGSTYDIAEAWPLKVRQPILVSGVISQQRPFPGVSNKIYVLFKTNVPLVKDTTIQFTGLNSIAGSSTITFAPPILTGGKVELSCWGDTSQLSDSDTLKFAHENENIGGFGTATCKQGTLDRDCTSAQLQLKVTVDAGTIPGRDYRIAFTMINPTVPQPAQKVYVQTNVIVISQVLLQPDPTECGVCTREIGDKAPLFIRNPKFNSVQAFQTNPWPGASNSLILRFEADTPLTVGTQIYVTVVGSLPAGLLDKARIAASTLDDAFSLTEVPLPNAAKTFKLIDKVKSYRSGIVSALIDPGNVGAGCASRVVTDSSVSDTSKQVSVSVQTQCGQISESSILAPGSEYVDPSLITIDYQCSTPPVVTYRRSDQILVDSADKDPILSDQTFILKVQSETSSCAKMDVRIKMTNPVPPLDSTMNGYTIKIKTVKESASKGQEIPEVPDVSVLDIVNQNVGVTDASKLTSFKFEMCDRADATPCKFKSSVMADGSDMLPMDAVERYFQPVSGDSTPFKVYRPAFILAEVGQQTPYPGAFNSIFFRFATNYVLKGKMSSTDDAGTEIQIVLDFPGASGVPATQQFPDSPTMTETRILASTVDDSTIYCTLGVPPTPCGASMVTFSVNTKFTTLVYGDYVMLSDVNFINNEVAKVIAVTNVTLTVLSRNTSALKDTSKFNFAGTNPPYVKKVVPLFDYFANESVSTLFKPNTTLESSGSTLTLTLALADNQRILPGRVYSFQIYTRNAMATTNFFGATVKYIARPAKASVRSTTPKWLEDFSPATVRSWKLTAAVGVNTTAGSVDAAPYRLFKRGLVQKNIRQSTAIPGVRNRLQAFVMPNFPMPIAKNLTFNAFRGATLFDGVLNTTCGNWTDAGAVLCDVFNKSQKLQFGNALVSTYLTDSGTSSWTGRNLQVGLNDGQGWSYLFNGGYPMALQRNETEVWTTVLYKAGDFIEINTEYMYVVGVDASITSSPYKHYVVRGQLGTTAGVHPFGSAVYAYLELGVDDFFSDASLSCSTATKLICPGSKVYMNFDVYNPAVNKNAPTSLATQDPMAVTITGVGFSEVAVTQEGSQYGLRYPDNRAKADYSTASDLQPMFVYPKGWIVSKIRQSAAWPGSKNNVINVTLVPSVTIFASDVGDYMPNTTSIILSGFANATAPGVSVDAPVVTLAVAGENAASFGGWGSWNDTAKSFTLQVFQTMYAGEDYMFQFSLINPLIPQEAPSITIQTGGPISELSWIIKDTTLCNFPIETFSGRKFLLKAVPLTGNTGSGFKGQVTFFDDKSIKLEILNGGSAYNATPTIEFEECPDATKTDKKTCGCAAATSNLVVANLDGIRNITFFNPITCNQTVTNGKITISTDGSGQTFGSGFEVRFDATADNQNISTYGPLYYNGVGGPLITQRIINFGSGYYHVPFWISQDNYKCVCDSDGDAITLDKYGTQTTSLRRGQVGPVEVTPDSTCQCRKLYLKVDPLNTKTFCSFADEEDYGLKMSGTVIMPFTVFDKSSVLIDNPLKVVLTEVKMKIISQLAPWPLALNTLIVTLQMNVELPMNSRITIEGLIGATMPASPVLPTATSIVTDDPVDAGGTGGPTMLTEYTTLTADLASTTASFKPNIEWQPVLTSPFRNRAVFTTKVDWSANEIKVLVFRITNPRAIAPDYLKPPDFINMKVTTEAGLEVLPRDDLKRGLLDYDTKDIAGIPQASRPLAIYTDTWPDCYKQPVNGDMRVPFHSIARTCPCNIFTNCPQQAGVVPALKRVVVAQTTCKAESLNTILVTISSNVVLGKKCTRPCFPSAQVKITGFKGTSITQPTFVCTTGTIDGCAVRLSDLGGSGGAGNDGLFGTTATFTRFRGGIEVGELQLNIAEGAVMVPGKDYQFSFQVNNGGPQSSPPLIAQATGTWMDSGYSGHLNSQKSEGLLNPRTGPACYDDGVCRNVRISQQLHATAGENSPLNVNALGAITGVTLTFVSKGKAKPGEAGDVRIDVGLAAGTTIKGGQTVDLTLDSFFGGQSATMTAKNDASAASWVAATSLLRLTTDAKVVKVGPTTFSAVVTMTMPRAGIRSCTAGTGVPCTWGYKTEPRACSDGVVEFNAPGYPKMTGDIFGSLYPTSISYDSTGTGTGVPGIVSVVNIGFVVGAMTIARGKTITITLPGFTGSGSGSNADFTYAFADNKLVLTSSADLAPGRGIATVVGKDAGIKLPLEGLTSSQYAGVTIVTNADNAPPVEQILSQKEINKFTCQSTTISASGTANGLCDASNLVLRMCAIDTTGLNTYATSKGLTGAGGYVGGKSLSASVNGTGSGSASDQCKAAQSSVCSSINATFTSLISKADTSLDVVASTCCRSSPATTTIGLGSLATCSSDADCTRGTLNNMPDILSVAVVDKLCCDFCYRFWGVYGCVLTDGSPPTKDHPDVIRYCDNVASCVKVGSNSSAVACYGYDISAGIAGPDSTLIRDGENTLAIPPNVPELKGIAVKLTELQTLPASSLVVVPGQLEVAGSIVRIEPSGITFSLPAVLALKLSADAFKNFPALLASFGLSRRQDTTQTTMQRIENSFFLLIHKLNTSVTPNVFEPVGPTWALKEVSLIKSYVLIYSFSVYTTIIRKGLPSVPEFPKPMTTSGDEAHITIAMASFLALLLFVIVLLPCCAREDRLPPLKPIELPPEPLPKAVEVKAPILSPPPPPPEPVFVREVEPQMRYNMQGAPIKHFGPPIWKPAPQNEYTVPIRTSPETEGQLGFDYGTSYSEAPMLRSMQVPMGMSSPPYAGQPVGFSSPPSTSNYGNKPFGYG